MTKADWRRNDPTRPAICITRVYVDKVGRRYVGFTDRRGIRTTTSYARLVAAVKLGRPLRDTEVVHHRNDDPTDDSFANLEVLASRSRHSSHHNRARYTARGCAGCGCHPDERTRGCTRCATRHAMRRQAGVR